MEPRPYTGYVGDSDLSQTC